MIMIIVYYLYGTSYGSYLDWINLYDVSTNFFNIFFFGNLKDF